MTGEIHPEDIEEAARQWLVYLYSEEADEEGRRRFEAWLSDSDERARAYRTLEQAWRDLALLEAEAPILPAAAMREDRPPLLTRRYALLTGGIAASVVFLLAAVVVFLSSGPASVQLDYASAVGEIRQIGLPDGSVVTLDSGAAIQVAFADNTRTVALDRGRAYFDVSKDAARPFTVKAGANEVVVTGTEFDLWRQASGVSIGVHEGRVEVGIAQADSEGLAYVNLLPGEVLLADQNGTLLEKKPVDVDGVGEWRTGRMSYTDARLAEVVDTINRYRRVPIMLMDPALADLRVTMSFRVDQTEEFIRGIEATQPVRVERTASAVQFHRQNPNGGL